MKNSVPCSTSEVEGLDEHDTLTGITAAPRAIPLLLPIAIDAAPDWMFG